MPINPVACILSQYPVMILDGALSTELERHGCDLNDPLWSAKILIENPQVIYQAHYDYFLAGADCVITSSYQASFDGFAKKGFSHQEGVALLQKSVEVAQKARSDFLADNPIAGRPSPLVAASIGPYGAYLADGSEYRGYCGVTDEVLKVFHQERMAVVLECAADILACETIPSAQEACVLLDLLSRHSGAYAWFSFTLKDGRHISDGSPLLECVKLLDASAQVAAIGVNCVDSRYVCEAISVIRQGTQKPVVVYPNAGQVYDASLKRWHGNCADKTPGLSQSALQWVERGARMIGGCCGTTAADIQKLAGLLRPVNG